VLHPVPAVKFLNMPFGDLRRRLDQSLFYDWAMRCPAVLFSSFILYRDVLSFCQKVVHNPALFEHFNGAVVIAMLAQISQWMFVFLLSILPLFRLRPIAKSDEILPRVVPLIVTCVPPMFMLLDRAPPDIAFNVPAVIIILLANVMAVATVSFLGRSLSLMPEARKLVRIGPYGIVRHPLYLCEMLGLCGIALQYRSLAAAALLLLVIGLQVARGRWEEGVLARAFPDFAAYRSQTSFLIPPDPLRFLASFVTGFAAQRRFALIVGSMVAVLALVATALPRLIV
jgi:protein-S-isoprenylcysteine O-methyltransferase Ste14